MIAFSRMAVSLDPFAAEARRRVGGRALVVSEYATRLVDAITRLVVLVDAHSDPSNPWSPDEYDEVFTLDGRIEAMRMRLGIPPMDIREREPTYGGRDATIGATRLGICRCSGSWDGSEVMITICTAVDDDWRERMKSLKAIGLELAVAPELDGEEQEIVELLIRVGHRPTTTQILDEFYRAGKVKGESTIKGKLAQLTKRRVLVNRTDTKPPGYGLPEWD